MMEAVPLSVIVCTRNRPQRLERCLREFEAATPPADSWELVVVVNDDGPESLAVVEAAARRGRLPLAHVVESTPGLALARNRGVATSRGEVVAFTDDDCLVSAGWMKAILDEFARDPALDVLGGRVDPADPAALAISLRPFPDPAIINSLPDIRRRLMGCNMAIRRQLFTRIGTFDTRMGPGAKLGAAEDLDFFYRALKSGAGIRYSPDVQLRHAHGRSAGDDLLPLKDGYVKGRGAFYAKHARRGDGVIMKHVFWEVSGLVRESFAGPAGDSFPPGRALRLLAAGAIAELTTRS